MATKTIPTVGELRKAAEVTDQEIDAAVDAYLANPKAEPFRFASGYEIDVAAAVSATTFSAGVTLVLRLAPVRWPEYAMDMVDAGPAFQAAIATTRAATIAEPAVGSARGVRPCPWRCCDLTGRLWTGLVERISRDQRWG
jgi:hypothetical protein